MSSALRWHIYGLLCGLSLTASAALAQTPPAAAGATVDQDFLFP